MKLGASIMTRFAIACGNEPYGDAEICSACDGKGFDPVAARPYAHLGSEVIRSGQIAGIHCKPCGGKGWR